MGSTPTISHHTDLIQVHAQSEGLQIIKSNKEIYDSMSFSIKRPVFAHDFLNPPTEDRNCNIDIMIADPSGKIILTKETPGLQTRFMLTIAEPSMIGITDSGQATVEKGIKDLLLAFNLGLVRTCMSTLGGDLYSAEIETKAPEAKITIEETPKGKNIKISETLTMRETLHITIGTREETSEQQAVNYLNRIINVKRSSPNRDLIKELNIGKALNEYESTWTRRLQRQQHS